MSLLYSEFWQLSSSDTGKDTKKNNELAFLPFNISEWLLLLLRQRVTPSSAASLLDLLDSLIMES